jgi:hypothetical protein
MATLKFDNTYELLKHLYLKGILKGYYIAGPNDGGSGAFPEILNVEINDILFYLFYENLSVCWDNGDRYDTNDIDLKIIDDELIILQTKSYSDFYDEMDDEIDSEEDIDKDGVEEEEEEEEEEAKEYIGFMVKFGYFEDKSYEFEECDLK